MSYHACFSILYGLLIVLLPHGFYERIGNYNYLTHESSRLYGCLTIGIGWLVWSARNIGDGRLVRATTEAFSIAYLSQGLVMLKALYSNISTLSRWSLALHLLVAFSFIVTGSMYAHVRLRYKIKDMELPGLRES